MCFTFQSWRDIPEDCMLQIQSIMRNKCLTRIKAIPILLCRQFTTDILPVFIEKYGCQMNHNDAEILLGIFERYNEGRDPRKSVCFRRTTELEDARVILIMTCAIRENAENKI